MSTEELVIAIIRIAGSLLVFRWAFAGGVIAILVDLADLFLRSYLQLGGISDYQSFDKWLDQVYLLAFLVVALRWQGTPRNVAVALYLYRLVGFVVFELTGSRAVLLAFPNVFEFWFLFVAAQRHWWPEFRYTRYNTTVVLGLLTVLKLLQEFVLHVAKWLDSFNARDLVEWVSRWAGV
jgi:hypothetical protein